MPRLKKQRSKGKKNYKNVVKAISKSTISQLKPLAKKLDVAMGETKYNYNTYGLPAQVSRSTAMAAGTFLEVTVAPQNITDTGRIGDKITLKSIDASVQFWINSTAATYDELVYVRYTLLQWYPISVPTGADIYMSAAIDSPFIHDKRNQFKVLRDGIKKLTVQNTATYFANPDALVSFKSKISSGFKRDINYNNAGVTGSNKIFFVCYYQPYNGVVTTFSDSVLYNPRFLVEYNDH